MEGLKESLGEKDMEENQEQSILENEKEENNPKKNKSEKNKVNNQEKSKEKVKNKKSKQELKEKRKIQKNKEAIEKNKKSKNAIDTMMEYRKRRILIPIITTIIIIIIAAFCSTIFALVNINNENIISGISIEGIDVSGLSKEEAKAKLENIYQEKKEKEIGIVYQEYTNTLNPTLLEVNYDIDKAVEEASSIGKSQNIVANNYEIILSLIKKRNINVEMTLNEDVAKQTIIDIGVNLPGIVIESSYAIEENELIITKGQTGIVIDEEKLLEEVKENDINANEDDIQIPVKQKAPEEIDINKIHEEVYKEAQNAYYEKEPFAIYPEVEGIDFDVETAKELLQEEKEEYVIPLVITKPQITLSQIGTEAFPNQLSTFTTRYDVSDVGRSTNLSVACQKLNGTVILPGETFSYNQTLGPRTIAAGYRTGKMYSGGQVVDSIGGGICQISSTLYNSVLMANLEIVERKNHQFVTAYVPAGRDATVAYGVIDFKFKNTRKYPIRLSASAKNGIATVSIYGIKEDNEYTFTFSTKTIASIPFTTQYQEDASLPAGTENVKQKGVNGLKTETYINKILDGKVISTTLLSRDTYDAMTRIVVRGKGQATNNTITTNTTTNNANNTTNNTKTNTTVNHGNKINNTSTVNTTNTNKKDNTTVNKKNTTNVTSNKKTENN